MAVPQLQLANLGEIFAQNQARQAEMDTMQLEQASAVEKMRQEQLARQKQSQLMELARTVDISTPQGAKQAFELGLMDLPTYTGVQKSATDMALAKQKQKASEQKAILEAANKPFNADGTPNPMYQAYEMARRQAGASRTTNIVSLPAVEESALVQGNKYFYEKAYPEVIKSGNSAIKGNDLLDRSSILLKESGSGWGKDTQVKAFQIASAFGLAPKEAKVIAANAEAFKSVLEQQVFTQLDGLVGTQTEGDSQRARNVFAQLGNTPEGNQFIIDLGKAKNNFEIKRAKFYTQKIPEYRAAGKGADLTRVEAEWIQNAPSIWDDPVMQKYLPKAQPTPSGGGQGGGVQKWGRDANGNPVRVQ